MRHADLRAGLLMHYRLRVLMVFWEGPPQMPYNRDKERTTNRAGGHKTEGRFPLHMLQTVDCDRGPVQGYELFLTQKEATTMMIPGNSVVDF